MMFDDQTWGEGNPYPGRVIPHAPTFAEMRYENSERMIKWAAAMTVLSRLKSFVVRKERVR